MTRSRPTPLIAFIGTFSAAERARIDAFFSHLDHVLRTVRHVTYAQAELDAAALADRLRREVDRAFLDEATFSAIPRGGLVVLAMLTAVLDIPRGRVHLSDPRTDQGSGPVVLVDDCAITGMRLREHLVAGRRTVVAHLYSHPDLRAVVREEPDVLACVAAQNLTDFAEYGGTAGAHRRRRWDSTTGERYWYGLPDYLTFAWKEPGAQLWNPVTEQMEGGWHTMPPELCLSNRRQTTPHGQVHVQQDEPGPIRSAATVFYGRVNGELVVGDARRDTMLALDDVGAAMWESVLGTGTVDGAVELLGQRYEVPHAQLARDLDAFVTSLRARELLEPTP